jgi:hypothetical protein
LGRRWQREGRLLGRGFGGRGWLFGRGFSRGDWFLRRGFSSGGRFLGRGFGVRGGRRFGLRFSPGSGEVGGRLERSFDKKSLHGFVHIDKGPYRWRNCGGGGTAAEKRWV